MTGQSADLQKQKNGAPAKDGSRRGLGADSEEEKVGRMAVETFTDSDEISFDAAEGFNDSDLQ